MDKFSFFKHYVQDVINLNETSLGVLKSWFSEHPATLEEVSDISLLEWCKSVGAGRSSRTTLSTTVPVSRNTLRTVLSFLGEVEEGVHFHVIRDRSSEGDPVVRIEGTFSFPDAVIDATTVARAYRFKCLFVIVRTITQILIRKEYE